MKDYLGSPVFFALLALVINGAIRALKTTPIPKSALPWVALVLGFGVGLVESLSTGHAWGVAALEGLKGLASGTGAIATNETLSTAVRAAWPGLADALFGPKAGPSSLPANVPTVSVPALPVPAYVPPAAQPPRPDPPDLVA